MLSNGLNIVLTSFVLLGTSVMTADAGMFNVAKKVMPVVSAPDDQFGRSVAIDGNIAIVGAWQFDYFGSGKTGYASVLDVATGHELARLTALDGSADDAFGIAVDLAGNIAVVGAGLDDDWGESSGSAYLFDITNGNQLYKLAASDLEADDQFGSAVAISGKKVLIGAPYNDESGRDSGAAYLFDASAGSQLLKLNPSDASAGALFGSSVAIDGGLAIVGADAKNNGAGAAYLYDVDTGFQLLKLTPADDQFEPHFGFSVSISGNRAIVGAPHGDNGLGVAYVFDSFTGAELFKLTAPDRVSRDYFGESVAIDGNLAIVGESGRDSDRGAAYVFDLTTGRNILELTAPDRELDDRFGEFVGIDGNSIVASVRLDDDHGSASGSVYLFTPEPSSFLLMATVSFVFCVPRGVRTE